MKRNDVKRSHSGNTVEIWRRKKVGVNINDMLKSIKDGVD